MRWLEFHDSELVSVVHDDESATLLLRGYVHRWELEATGWIGTGWSQQVHVTVRAATVQITVPPACEQRPDIWDGTLRCSSVSRKNLIPLPFDADGDIFLSLDLVDGRTVKVNGTGVHVEPHGEAILIEGLDDELRPPDAV